jgi:threonine dehydrogenase-like Zn-dependent dehydrogenase
MCGTDVEQYEGAAARAGRLVYPVIPGHETVGRIVELDDATKRVWGLDAGARVAIISGSKCGVCRFCRMDHPGFKPCLNGVTYGFRPTTFGSGLFGGMSEYMHLLPGTMVMPVPDDLSIEDAVFFNPLAAGFDWAVRAAGTQVGDTVLVLGAGQRGLACVIAAREAGAGQIIVTGLERDRRRLAIAADLGATTTVNVDSEDVVTIVRDLTNGVGAHRIVDATPYASQPVLDALEAAAWGATIVFAGIKAGRPVPEFPVDAIIHKVLNVVGVLGTSVWASEKAMETIASKRYALQALHTHTVGLDEVDWAVRVLGGEVDGEDAIHITVTP